MKIFGAETASTHKYHPTITRRSCLATLTVICLYSGTTVCSGFLVGNDLPQLLLAQNLANISFSDEWQLLGPFHCGTREAIWGADPLEFYGGFHNLSFDANASFNSALAVNGSVKWKTARALSHNFAPGKTRTELHVSFPEIDWKFTQAVYGWSALQYQAWARGSLNTGHWAPQSVAIFTSGLLEIVIDGKRHFGGDFYNYGTVPIIIDLSTGDHAVELRLVRDVRASGAIGEPTIVVSLAAEIRNEPLSADNESLLLPDMCLGKLGTPWASINLHNNIADRITILAISSIGAQKLTYYYAGIVSYAILRPPPVTCAPAFPEGDGALPVIVGLHGAGVKADSVQVREMLDAAYGTCAWIISPSGVTPWSGDDWHTWGAGDVEAAVDAIARWIDSTGWDKVRVSQKEWIVVGHSNGGQGAWFLATHYPDKVIAAAPVSGYSSIERFRASALIRALEVKTQWRSQYDELQGQNHWFDGVLTTPSLLAFYNQSATFPRRPRLPLAFTITVPSSANIAKGGIYVDQLRSPDRNGVVQVIRDARSGIWYVNTTNIHRFHLSPRVLNFTMPSALVLDGRDCFEMGYIRPERMWFLRDSRGRWTVSEREDWRQLNERYGRQLGTVDAILRTKGPFNINICSAGLEHIAVQISRNFLQYFAADSQLSRQCGSLIYPDNNQNRVVDSGNVVTLALGNELPSSKLKLFPIRIQGQGLSLFQGCCWPRADTEASPQSSLNRECNEYEFPFERGMGALFLRPLENERLELVVWGADLSGLEQAARFVPTLTACDPGDIEATQACFMRMDMSISGKILSSRQFALWQFAFTSGTIIHCQGCKQSSTPSSTPDPLVSSKLGNFQPTAVEVDVSSNKKQMLEHLPTAYPSRSSEIKKLLAKLSPKPQSSPFKPVEDREILTKLSEQQALLEQQNHLLASTSASIEDHVDRDKNSAVKPLTSTLKASHATGNIDNACLAPTNTEMSEVLRLKKELLAANSKLALQEQELAQTRVIKHTLDQALGTPSEADFSGREVTEHTISHLQSVFNAPSSNFTQSHEGWNTHDDSQSDVSEALSTGTYSGARGFWFPQTQQVFGMHMNAQAGERAFGEHVSLSSNTFGPEANRFWTNPTASISMNGSFQPHRVLSGPSFGTCNSTTQYTEGSARYSPNSAQRCSVPHVNRAGPCFSAQNPSWEASFNTASPSNQLPRAPTTRPCSTYQQVGLYPIQPYQRPIGTSLSPTANEFTSSGASAVPWTTSPTYISPLEPLNYRRLLDKNVSCDWKYIVDKIICNNDQQASIFLQQKLKVGTAEQKYDIIEAITHQAYPLMVNRFGNFLVQRCFEHGTTEQVVAIANAIKGNTLSLSMDPFGCHVVQKAFDSVPEEHKAVMVHELLCRIPETVIHRYACHVWQKLFELRWSGEPPQIMAKVNEALQGMWHEVALGETGSLVVQNIFENCVEDEKRPAIEEVIAKIDVLAHGQFGNWCIQHICEHGAPQDKTRAIEHVLLWSVDYSMDQFASKIVEKCLKIGGSEFLDRYLSRVCTGRTERPRMPLIDIAGDQYGNYLIQWILMNAAPHQRELVASHIRYCLASLYLYQYNDAHAMIIGSTWFLCEAPNLVHAWQCFAATHPIPPVPDPGRACRSAVSAISTMTGIIW
ncbi:Pumilio-family RNA binding repeat domain-containing protein [Aspergillus fumigatus Z5]|nr:Pumilio-family RNA binding repeat domain-containing protein [Aspergillus fumigatus Z5]